MLNISGNRLHKVEELASLSTLIALNIGMIQTSPAVRSHPILTMPLQISTT